MTEKIILSGIEVRVILKHPVVIVVIKAITVIVVIVVVVVVKTSLT